MLVALSACAQTMQQAGQERFSSNDAATLQPCVRNAKAIKTPCRLASLPTLDVLDRIANSANAQAAGDTLTFAVRAPAVSFVNIVGGLRTSAQRAGNSDIWAASVLVPELQQARIGFQFITDSTRTYAAPHEFRGPASVAGPLRSAVLHGSMTIDTVYSYALAEKRVLITYMPPRVPAGRAMKVIYAADGALVYSLAPAIDTLITTGAMEPTVIVGVRAADGPARTSEYVYGYDADSTRFLAHEKFFVEEVTAWAEANLHAASSREEKTIWGASNGGAFAIAMGLRHPESYSRVIALSPVYADIPLPRSTKALPQFFLAAGTFEETTQVRAGLLVNALRGMHAPTKFEEFVGGHDALVWVDTSVREFVSPQ